jgi:hypothetical protein
MTQTRSSKGHQLAGIVIAAIRVVGSVPVAIFIAVAVGYLSYAGIVGAIATLAIGLLIGISVGIIGTLKFIDYAVTYQPVVFVDEYKKWKDDGRWDAMLAKMDELRAGAHK